MSAYLKHITIKIRLLLLFVILIQCHTTNTNLKSNKINRSKIAFFERDINFIGKGKSGLASYYLDWNIYVINSDSIIMLSSQKKNEEDRVSNTNQFYGRLKKGKKYSYEIKISNFLSVDWCMKAKNRSLDFIPFIIDTTLYETIAPWKLTIHGKKDTLLVNSMNFSYKTNTKDKKINFLMTIIPSKKSGFFPIVIRNSPLCTVRISNRIPECKFYLNKNEKNYELIIERTINCTSCIKREKLKLVNKNSL